MNFGDSGRELVLAVEFDAVFALQRAFREDAKPALLKDIEQSPAALTLAGDGGPVRRTSMTIFTLTASSSLLRKGRTALIPILVILGGEQAVHSAVGERLRERVKAALLADYSVPVRRPRDVPMATGTARSASAGVERFSTTVEASATPSGAPHAPANIAPTMPDTHPALATVLAAPATDLPWSTAALRFLFLLRLCGDFAMIAHFLTLTGCSDGSRCPYSWPCLPASYLSVALLTAVSGRSRDGSLLSAHWELVVWGLARWCTLRGGRWKTIGGRLVWSCAACKRNLVGYSTSGKTVACTAPLCPMQGKAKAELLQRHAYTPLSDVFRLLRRRLGGPRGYPLVGDIPFLVQAPVMHCCGKLGKCVIYFMLALLPETHQARARRKIYALLGRSNTGAMYLREFGRLGAMVIALPGVLGANISLDTGAVLMLRLCQLLTASWRRALVAKSTVERERAAAALQVAAALLAPLYAALKPHDPVTKKAGVLNLYLHTAMAHVRQTLGNASPLLRFISDDHIEGTIADMNRYFRLRTNNVSRGQSVVNKQALIPPEFKGEKEVKTAEKMLFTKDIAVCPCVTKIGLPTVASFEAVVRFACSESELSVTVAESAAVTSPKQMALVASAKAAVTAATEAAAVASDAKDVAVAAEKNSTAPTSVDEMGTVEPGANVADALSAERAFVAANEAAKAAAKVAEEALVVVFRFAPLLIKLHAGADEVAPNLQPMNVRGMDGELQEKLEATQRRIHMCLCGALTGGAPAASVIARTAMEATAAARAAATANNSSRSPADADETVNAGLNHTEHVGCPRDSTTGTATRTAGGAEEAMLGGAAAVEANWYGSAHDEEAGDGHWYDDDEFPGGGSRMEAGGASRGDQGEDIVLPDDEHPDLDTPVHGDRSYQLDDLELTDSDNEGDEGAAAAVAATNTGVGSAEHSTGNFLLQLAIEDANLALALPATAVVDVVLGGTVHTPGSLEASTMRCRLEEELTMMELFITRMRTPDFESWARKDGVLLRDVALAAERLRHTLLTKMVALDVGDSEEDVCVTE